MRGTAGAHSTIASFRRRDSTPALPKPPSRFPCTKSSPPPRPGSPKAGPSSWPVAMRHTSGSFEARDGLSLFRQTWLPDTPPHAALINLHGLGDHSGLHARLVEWMVERGIGVYAYDARGNGRSGGQRAYVDRWSDYLDDLGRFVALVRAETGDVPLFLAGTSLGGLVAIDYALTQIGRASCREREEMPEGATATTITQ